MMGTERERVRADADGLTREKRVWEEGIGEGQDWEERAFEVLRILPRDLREKLRYGIRDFGRLEELRFRAGGPLGAVYEGKNRWVTRQGMLSDSLTDTVWVTVDMSREMLEYISSYSFYAFEEEIRQGFITIPGGHRIGLAGKTVIERGTVKTIRHISFLNIRLSHQICGCAKKLLPFLYQDGKIGNTLLISPPRAGKTTLLRDLVRLVSDGNAYGEGVNTGVVDERGELAACYQGIPQNDLGRRTDVLDGCPKAQGIVMLLRSMAPAVIAVDELGTAEDVRAMESAMNSGCAFLATAHGGSLEEIRRKPLFRPMMEAGLFQRIGVLHVKRDGEGDGAADGYRIKSEAMGRTADRDRVRSEVVDKAMDRNGGKGSGIVNRGIRLYDGDFREITEGELWY